MQSPLTPLSLGGLNALEGLSVRWLDVLGLTIVVIFTVLGVRRGLWWQLVRLLGLVCALAVARAAAPWFGARIDAVFAGLGPRVANGLAWAAIFAAGLLAVALIGRIGRASLEAAQLGWIDRIGGALAGAASGALVYAVVLVCLCQTLPEETLRQALRGSRSERVLAALERGIPAILDARAADSVRPYVSTRSPR